MQKAKKVKLTDYELLQTLGTGSFGRVRLSKNKSTNKYLAMKILKKSEIIRLKQVDHIINENTILSNITHPFIVNMDGFTQDERFLYFALEYIPGGELFSYLRSIGRLDSFHAAYCQQQNKMIFKQIDFMLPKLHAFLNIYMQKTQFIDLKPENLLIATDGYLKLTDFGFAKIVEGRTYTLCGTPEYLAPEILLNKGHGKPVDWWTLGILIYEMNAGIDPFSDEDPMAIYQKILKGKIKFPRNFDKNAKSIVKHLLVADLSKRYGNLKNGFISQNYFKSFKGVNDIKKHRWFKEIDWTALIQKKIKAPYKPVVKGPADTSNFSTYPDSETQTPALKQSEDPFLDW